MIDLILGTLGAVLTRRKESTETPTAVENSAVEERTVTTIDAEMAMLRRIVLDAQQADDDAGRQLAILEKDREGLLVRHGLGHQVNGALRQNAADEAAMKAMQRDAGLKAAGASARLDVLRQDRIVVDRRERSARARTLSQQQLEVAARLDKASEGFGLLLSEWLSFDAARSNEFVRLGLTEQTVAGRLLAPLSRMVLGSIPQTLTGLQHNLTLDEERRRRNWSFVDVTPRPPTDKE